MDEWDDPGAIDKLRIVKDDIEAMTLHCVDVIGQRNAIQIGCDVHVGAQPWASPHDGSLCSE